MDETRDEVRTARLGNEFGLECGDTVESQGEDMAVRDLAVNKPRPDLISPFALWRIGELYRKGAKKYQERNWEKGMSHSRCVASMFRHVLEYMMGMRNEDHLAAVCFNAMSIIHFEEMEKSGVLPDCLNDMPTYDPEESTAEYES